MGMGTSSGKKQKCQILKALLVVHKVCWPIIAIVWSCWKQFNVNKQIKKDFDLANIAIEVPSEITPTALKSVIHEKLYVLLVERFDQYLNLLYVIDISEREVKNIQAMDAVDVTAEVTFLLLKREWQKVWYKAKYSS
jgi:hypothetical protein